MKPFNFKYFLILVFFLPVLSNGQAKSYIDAAQMYNKMLLETGNSTVVIGNFKVKGTPYFYGGHLAGKLFLANIKEAVAYISYNTYDQSLEYSSSADKTQKLYKPDVAVDSFVIQKNNDLQIMNEILFVNGKNIHTQDKSFYQRVYNGPKFFLFKKYKSELGIVSTNYVQSDLRQFDLSFEYYYFDSSVNDLKRLKTSVSYLKKEFKQNEEVASIISSGDFSYEPEKSLIKVFEVLNK